MSRGGREFFTSLHRSCMSPYSLLCHWTLLVCVDQPIVTLSGLLSVERFCFFSE